MTLKVAQIEHTIVDIDLRNKPSHMLRVSPKGTVPVLCLSDTEIIDESLDIMQWALSRHDPQQWLRGLHDGQACELLGQTDGAFKQALDRYKYASRFPDADPVASRGRALDALIRPLSERLATQPFIGGQSPVLQDVAIFPFVRQFAGVDPQWFESQAPLAVQHWLKGWVESDLFKAIMQKPSKPPQPPKNQG